MSCPGQLKTQIDSDLRWLGISDYYLYQPESNHSSLNNLTKTKKTFYGQADHEGRPGEYTMRVDQGNIKYPCPFLKKTPQILEKNSPSEFFLEKKTPPSSLF